MLAKRKSRAFGRDIYLLGKNKRGELLWLEATSWDCNWYWGFGYIETYTNNKRPDLVRDISSHSHWSGLIGKQERYDRDKGCFVLDSQYIHYFNENHDIAETVLTDKESRELADLMKSFYTLKDMAEIYHIGNSRTSATGICLSDKAQEDNINQVLMPKIFNRVYQILSPKEE